VTVLYIFYNSKTHFNIIRLSNPNLVSGLFPWLPPPKSCMHPFFPPYVPKAPPTLLLKLTTEILLNNQLDAIFRVFIYFMSLHVSSVIALIIRRSDCINTSSGVISLCKWLLGMPARHTKQSLTQTNRTIWCINLLKPNEIYTYMSYRSANLLTLHFKYLFNKYTYWIF